MNPWNVNHLASLLTEDPDILVELDSTMNTDMGASPPPETGVQDAQADDQSVMEPKAGEEKPLTAAEVDKQAEKVAGEKPDQEVADQIKAQQEADRQKELQRRQLLEPQMNDLNKSMDSLRTGITQGVSAAKTGGDAFGGLDKQLAQINSILSQLQKQMY